MKNRNFIKKGLTLTALAFLLVIWQAPSAMALTDLEQLGKHLFFDTNLSTPPGMSCASCHAPEVGWTGPDSAINAAGAVMPGVVHTRAGNRKPPSAAYAGESPALQLNAGLFLGGMFWDGRATGWTLGDPLQEQALGPFLNPVEMKDPNAKVIIRRILKSKYAQLFKQVYLAETGKRITLKKFDLNASYQVVGKAIAAYERSAEVNPFDSRFDDFWRTATAAGIDVSNEITYFKDELPGNMFTGNLPAKLIPYQGLGLSDRELMGLAVFNGMGKCSACHVLTPSGAPDTPKPPLFTDFSYDNLGVPKNPLNPFYTQPPKINPLGDAWVDQGLGDFLAKTVDYASMAQVNYGKQKVPTLRNVDKRPYPEFVKAYGHNGYFKSTQQITHFYNTRDIPGQGWPPLGMGLGETVPWPAPEVAMNVNTAEVGNLGLNPTLGMPILEFLKTLSDRSTPTAP